MATPPDLETVLTLAARYGARLSTVEQDGPLPDCELCSDHPAHPGCVAISSTDVPDMDVCWDHVQYALELVAQRADEEGDRCPELTIEVTTPAVARMVAA